MKQLKIYYLISTIFLMLCIVSAATNWIWSNTVSVTVSEYHLTLNPINQSVTRYQNATFIANLTLGNNPIPGATIYLYYGNETFIGVSNITDISGSCRLIYTVIEPNGTYTFKAGFQI